MAQRQDSKRTYTAGLCHRNALHVVKLGWTTHPHIGFDAAGVRWLDRYIEDTWQHLDTAFADEFVQLMGCFYGEILIATFGGSWVWSHDRLGVLTPGLGYTFPFAAIAKQLQFGQSASIATSYFAAVKYLEAAA